MVMKRIGVMGAGRWATASRMSSPAADSPWCSCDVEGALPERGLASIEKNLDREVAKNKITAVDSAATLRASLCSPIAAKLADCDLVIEAATEKFEIKSEIFRDPDPFSPPDDLSRLQYLFDFHHENRRPTGRPDKVIGMHFFNPVPVMKLVEIIRGLATSQATYEGVRDLAIKLDKTPVEVNDAPGFVSNRVLMPLLNEAMFAVMEGVLRRKQSTKFSSSAWRIPWAR